jgi:DNA-binding ferritin-like protein (Dps family)
MKPRYRQYLEMVTGPLEDKKRFRQYKARAKQLPANYHAAIEALERYMEYFGPGDSDSLLAMLEDLADLFEQSTADGTPIREIVGQDPVEFAEAFLRNYSGDSWVRRERDRLTDAIDRASGDRA